MGAADPLAAVPPATQDESAWGVETGEPNWSAAAMAAIAARSAEAPWI